MAYKRKPYRTKRSIKVFFWSFVVLIIFSAALTFMEKPTTGTIIQKTAEDSPGQEETAKTNTITAKYFSLQYNAGLDTVSDISSGDKTALEVYRVARSDISGRRTFVATIKKLPQGGLSEESSYRLRHIKPAEYRESAATFGPTAFTLMEKLDGTELTAFSVNGDKLAMLAYTLSAPDGNLYKEASELLANFRWL